MNRIAIAALACLACATTPEVKKAPATPPVASDKWVGDVREVMLSNGLKVLLKEDHNAPVATFVVYYKVGSRNEHVGITGSSHLLEHLQFKGSKAFPGKTAIFGGLSNIGASFNATTFYDRTNYFETVPIDKLPFAIELEADRMRNSTFTDEDRQSEMTVVRNELERNENEPGTLLQQLLWATSIIAHPYHHPVIGWRSDVEHVPTSQLRSYYDTYYQPDNAVAVAVGDFKTDAVLQLIIEKFGVHPGGHTFPPVYTVEEPQRGERRFVISKPGELGIVALGWHFPKATVPDAITMKVLQLVLAGSLDLNEFGDALDSGISNRLYQALVEKQLASNPGMDYTLMIDPTVGSISARVRPGVQHHAVEQAIRGEIRRLWVELVTSAELDRAKKRAKAAFALSQDGTFGQAMELGYFGLIGDWRFVRSFSEVVDTVTAEDIKRVAATYMTDAALTVGWFVPEKPGPGDGASAEPAGKAAQYRPADDRAEARVVTQRALAARDGSGGDVAPKLQKRSLSNGLRVVVQESHSNPTFAMAGSILAGSVHETTKELGLAEVTAELIQRGTKAHTKLQIAASLEEVGASFGMGGGSEYVSVSARALSADLDRVLDVFAEEMLSPSLPADELKKLVSEQVAAVQESEDSTRVKAHRALSQGLYPKGDPRYEDNPVDIIKALESFTPERARQWHETYYGPDRTVLVFVGDLNPDELFAKIEKRLGAWKKVGGPPVSAPMIPLRTSAEKKVIPVPDKSNVDIYMGEQGSLTRADADYYPAMIGDYVLGGSLSSRLFSKVRNDLGLTYDIDASFSATRIAGPWIINVSTNPLKVNEAIDATQQTMTLWHDKGITAEEMANAKQSVAGLFMVTLATNAGLASTMSYYEFLGLGAEYVTEHPKRIQAVTLEQVNQAIRTRFAPDKLLTVVCGTLPDVKK